MCGVSKREKADPLFPLESQKCSLSLMKTKFERDDYKK
jgi:hypothetical protein